MIVARGGEGGGHGDASIGTLPLLDAVLEVVSVPVLAAGGIASARSLAAVLAAGASGAWPGTCLSASVEALTTDEPKRPPTDYPVINRDDGQIRAFQNQVVSHLGQPLIDVQTSENEQHTAHRDSVCQAPNANAARERPPEHKQRGDHPGRDPQRRAKPQDHRGRHWRHEADRCEAGGLSKLQSLTHVGSSRLQPERALPS